MTNEQFAVAAEFLGSAKLGEAAREGARLRLVDGLSIEQAASEAKTTRSSVFRFSKRISEFQKAVRQFSEAGGDLILDEGP
jgi:hypothetical protein